ncbi:MAG: hypothetical protein ACTSQU_16400 [Promethearchaeota archaeon]
MDSEINPVLLSSFVGALSLFGSESLGKIEEITIKGLSIQMIIVNKFDLVLIAIMDKDFIKEDMRKEAEKALDMFYHLYKNEISDSTDVFQFESFKKILYDQIVEYFNRVNDKNNKAEIKDFGFFTDAVAQMKN